MQLATYHFNTDREHLDYEFFSEGPKGKIKKVVRFTEAESNGVVFYNLGFGDWDAQNGLIDDFIVSNNADAEKVLATVAAIVVDFTNRRPQALIYAEGSISARTRRYQMGINMLWDTIKSNYQIYGIKSDDTIEQFEKNVNYVAFLFKRI